MEKRTSSTGTKSGADSIQTVLKTGTAMADTLVLRNGSGPDVAQEAAVIFGVMGLIGGRGGGELGDQEKANE